VEKNVVALIKEAASAFSASNMEWSKEKVMEKVGTIICVLRNPDGTEFGKVRLEDVGGSAFGGAVAAAQLGASVATKDGVSWSITNELKTVSFDRHEVISAWLDMQAERAGEDRDPGYFTAKKGAIFTSLGKRLMQGVPRAVINTVPDCRRRLNDHAGSLAIARKEVERQEILGGGGSADGVFQFSKGVLSVLESALKSGVRKYETVDARLAALSEAVNEENKRTVKVPNDGDTTSEDAESVPAKTMSAMAWKLDLLLSVRDDLESWADRREASLEALRAGRMPDDPDEVRYAGAERNQDDARSNDLNHGLE
jgi:hypothetical protein